MIESGLIQQLINGVALGCIYALIALGYALVFGIMRLIFFAQGELCMVSAFAAVGAVSWLGGPENTNPLVTLTVALAAGIGVAVLTGIISERLAIRPIRRAPRTKQLIASLGVSLILQNLFLILVGAGNFPFPRLLPETMWMIGGVIVSPAQIFILVFSLLLMLGLHLVLHTTFFGLKIRAVSESAETAELDGINVDRTILITFMLGSILAGFAGIMMGSYDGVTKYNMGFLPGIKGFTAAILGGFGSPVGAMVGGIVLGLAETLAAGYVSSTYKDVIAFGFLILILLFRPNGLIGKS